MPVYPGAFLNSAMHGWHPATIGPPTKRPLMTAATTRPTDLGAYWAQPVAVSREQP
jgi:hypothetical protein